MTVNDYQHCMTLAKHAAEEYITGPGFSTQDEGWRKIVHDIYLTGCLKGIALALQSEGNA